MRVASLLLILCPVTAFAAPPILPTPSIGRDAPRCSDPMLRTTAERPATGVRKLGDLPPANQYLAVDRHVGGCRKPIMVRTGIGKR